MNTRSNGPRAASGGSTDDAAPTWMRARAATPARGSSRARPRRAAAPARWCRARRRRHAAQERDARVAAERADLDGAPRARGARQHLQVARVERRDLDVGQPGGGAARADVGQHVVFGRVDARDVVRQRRAVVAEWFVQAVRSLRFDPAAPIPDRQQRLDEHEHDRRRAQRVPQLEPTARRRARRAPRARARRAACRRPAAPDPIRSRPA